MYHEQTYEQIRMRRIRRFVMAFVVIVLVAVVVVAAHVAQRTTTEQGVASIRSSVLNTAQQCFAIEGSYPSSLKHLEDVYGLTVNHDTYIVYYEWMADNVPPTVTVNVREADEF